MTSIFTVGKGRAGSAPENDECVQRHCASFLRAEASRPADGAVRRAGAARSVPAGSGAVSQLHPECASS